MARTTLKSLENQMNSFIEEQKEFNKTMMENQKMLMELIGKKDKKETKKQAKKKTTKAEETKKPQTRAEGIDAWCKKKGYTEADRKAYGAAKKAERELQKEAYEMTNAMFSEKVEYKVWRAQYEANLVKLQAQAK